MLRALLFLRLLILITFVFGCATVIPKEIKFTKTGERLITVCVLNDAFFPVSEHIIGITLDNVFQEYKTFANIVFQRESIQMFHEDVTAQPIEEYASKMWRNCREVQGIKIVFSNRSLTVAHFPSANQEFPPDTKQAGVASSRWGTVLLYSVTEQWYERDLKGNSALITALKHEIGHCFGLEHVLVRESFMYSTSLLSFGQWTNDIIAGIGKNYRKTWYKP